MKMMSNLDIYGCYFYFRWGRQLMRISMENIERLGYPWAELRSAKFRRYARRMSRLGISKGSQSAGSPFVGKRTGRVVPL